MLADGPLARQRMKTVGESTQPEVVLRVRQIEDVLVVDDDPADDGVRALELRIRRDGRRRLRGKAQPRRSAAPSGAAVRPGTARGSPFACPGGYCNGASCDVRRVLVSLRPFRNHDGVPLCCDDSGWRGQWRRCSRCGWWLCRPRRRRVGYWCLRRHRWPMCSGTSMRPSRREPVYASRLRLRHPPRSPSRSRQGRQRMSIFRPTSSGWTTLSNAGCCGRVPATTSPVTRWC